MSEVLFAMVILGYAMMLIGPLASKSLGKALYMWFSGFMGVGACMYFATHNPFSPAWQAPGWYSNNTVAIISWSIVVVGLIVAIRKPRKKTLQSAQ